MLIPPIFVNNSMLNNTVVDDLYEKLPDDVMKSLNDCNAMMKTTWDSNDEEVEQ